jgi:hypothetical protein
MRSIILGAIVMMMLPGRLGPTLSIQLVEPGWLPLAGMDLRLQPVEACGTTPLKAVGDLKQLKTNKAGIAQVEVTGPADYQITVPSQGGAKRTMKCVHLFGMKPEDTPSVQLVIEPNGG